MNYAPSSDQVLSKVVAGEAVIIDLTTGAYYSLEGTAAKIWRDLCEGVDRDTLIDGVKQAYAGDPEAVTLVEAFVDQLVADALLAPVEAPVPNSDPMEAIDWPETFSAPECVCFDDMADMVALDPPLPELQSYSTDR